MRILLYVLAILALVPTMGCSRKPLIVQFSSSETQLPSIANTNSVIEVVSGTLQNVKTSSGYTVSVDVGPLSGNVETTTASGYVVDVQPVTTQ